MELEQARKRAEELRVIIERNNRLYYDQDAPELEDFEYDALTRELKALEAEFPQLVTVNSPTQKVGGTPSGRFAKVTHAVKMERLLDAFSYDELRDFDRRVREAAEFVELPQSVMELSPFELSGGQKRRVAIAGVIAMEPKVLILDEPTAGLDPRGREEILRNIRNYQSAKQATVIMVSHSMEEIADSVERLVVVNDAHIPMDGTPREVFSHGEELEAMGLAIPQVTRIFRRLKELGLPVDASVYTTAQAVQVLEALKGGGAAC